MGCFCSMEERDDTASFSLIVSHRSYALGLNWEITVGALIMANSMLRSTGSILYHRQIRGIYNLETGDRLGFCSRLCETRAGERNLGARGGV